MPPSIGLQSQQAIGGWLPVLGSLSLVGLWQALWHLGRSLSSVIVVPNLAPPG
jgi:hypothetical protein